MKGEKHQFLTTSHNVEYPGIGSRKYKIYKYEAQAEIMSLNL